MVSHIAPVKTSIVVAILVVLLWEKLMLSWYLDISISSNNTTKNVIISGISAQELNSEQASNTLHYAMGRVCSGISLVGGGKLTSENIQAKLKAESH